MDLFLLAMRIIIGFIFLSSAISKLNNMTEHIVTVRKYKILPSRMVRSFSYFETFVELIASLLIIIGYKVELAGLILLALLSTYTFAIVINLLRGNTNISCGCGGVVGNHILSWVLPLRNLFFSIGVVFLIIHENYIFSVESILTTNYQSSIKSVHIFYTVISSMLFMMIYSNITSLIHIKKSFNDLLKNSI
ncbi:MauE/DoxX family redox-associated membrane protein [Paenisporosarcina indica]|uniref:MauE/DoxX family redox-associated membrane protein n=1 Tax=Paenisporosarcina indica TaxID=650093 RepID=UPI00094FDB6C